MTISRRKREHVDIALKRDVAFRDKTSGFEAWDFVHCALPEAAFDAVDTRVEFLGRGLSFPFMVSAMTGGFRGAADINRRLAEVCQTEKIALGVGSQRQAFENDRHLETFRVVRRLAPDIPVVGNIGASEITRLSDFSPVEAMVDLVSADAMAVHLNPLQELLQPEGNRDFSGVLAAITRLTAALSVPVIVKEVGCGISTDTARRLVEAGVSWIDVAGSGGTSWTGIESHRGGRGRIAAAFWDWGIPTAVSIRMVRSVPGASIIASGGIRNGLEAAKAVALGAELCGAAMPVLRSLDAGPNGLVRLISEWRDQFRAVLYLTGSRACADLRRPGVLRYAKSEAP
ncbi:type 2 isopentenyl-diphosphate Delta-isomerase [bacterium]|nr:type 2 isopentenyl-diphosphate Delta-isomerase [bacterium]